MAAGSRTQCVLFVAALVATWLCFGAAGPAFAQQAQPAPPPAPPAVEEYIITGSRIWRSNLTELGPITVVTSEDIARSGATTLDELLTKLPSVTFQGFNKNLTGGGEGLAMIDLRNLGVQRTLVLINGRRVVTNGTTVEEAVDLNNIPPAMVERIEVLLEGASAVYGSDAVGGVVNFILKDDFEGLQLDAFGGISSQWDSEEGAFSATFGDNFEGERGNVTISLSYLDREPLSQADRSWAKEPVVAEIALDPGVLRIYGSGTPPEGRVTLPTGRDVYFLPDPATGASYSRFRHVQADSSDRPLFGDRYNYGRDQYLVGGQQRLSFTLNSHYTVLEESAAAADDVDVFLEAMYSHRTSEVRFAPYPLFDDELFIPANNPFVPADFAPLLGSATSFGMARRMTELGDGNIVIDADFYRVVGGVRGELFDRFDWEAFVNWGRTDQDQVNHNAVNLQHALNAANVDPSNPKRCAPGPIRVDPGCVPANYFGAGSLYTTPGAIDYIEYTDSWVTILEQRNVGVNVSGDLFDPWGAGPIGFATGAEYRQEKGADKPSAETVSGEAGFTVASTEGEYEVWDVFAELRIPLLNEKFLVHDLRFDAALRWSDYDSFGSDDTYRLGLQYAPTPDLRFRAIYSTAFRAPGISDLFGGLAESFEFVDDPCSRWDQPGASPVRAANCSAGGGPFNLTPVPAGFDRVFGDGVPVDVGGNPELGAETSELWNLGVILTPRFVPEFLDFSLSVDWYDITVKNAIEGLETQFIADTCYDSPGLSASTCAFLTRNSSSGVITNMVAREMNLSRLKVRGFDMTASFGFELSDVGLPAEYGRLDFSFIGNHLHTHDETSPAGTAHLAGEIEFLFAGLYPRYQLAAVVQYSVGGFTLQNRVHWLPGGDILGTRPLRRHPSGALIGDVTSHVQSVTYWDLAAEYETGPWRLIVGMNNVTDEEPPYFPEGGQNASPANYDFVGRFLFTRVTYSF